MEAKVPLIHSRPVITACAEVLYLLAGTGVAYYVLGLRLETLVRLGLVGTIYGMAAVLLVLMLYAGRTSDVPAPTGNTAFNPDELDVVSVPPPPTPVQVQAAVAAPEPIPAPPTPPPVREGYVRVRFNRTSVIEADVPMENFRVISKSDSYPTVVKEGTLEQAGEEGNN